MSRLMAIDYGTKRVGIAVSDPMQMIANGLTTVLSHDIYTFLSDYFTKEKVERVIVGYPVQLNNKPAEAQKFVDTFITAFGRRFPSIPLEKYDERFTSQMAMQTMIDGGLKKKDRQNKALIDTISATIILQDYMRYKTNTKDHKL